MAIRKIRKIGDPVLREKSKKIGKIDQGVLRLIDDMIDTITKRESSAAGLAAPQIGVSKRVIIVNFEDKIQTYINPEIEILDNEEMDEKEGCLSIYSIPYNIKRAKKVRVRAEDLKGNRIELEASGLLARIFQHELDHLNGVLIIDHLDAESKREMLSKISEINSG